MMSGDGRSLALALALIAIVVQRDSIQVHLPTPGLHRMNICLMLQHQCHCLISRFWLPTLQYLPFSAHNPEYFVALPISNYKYKPWKLSPSYP
jgi:hypothetical protein